jgi:hypothetical protein
MKQSADKEIVVEFYHKPQGVLFTLFSQPPGWETHQPARKKPESSPRLTQLMPRHL